MDYDPDNPPEGAIIVPDPKTPDLTATYPPFAAPEPEQIQLADIPDLRGLGLETGGISSLVSFRRAVRSSQTSTHFIARDRRVLVKFTVPFMFGPFRVQPEMRADR